MKLCIMISGLLFCSTFYAQTNIVPSTERKVMEDKAEVQPESPTDNAYLMSKNYKDSTTSHVYIVPEVKTGSKQKEQTNAKNPR